MMNRVIEWTRSRESLSLTEGEEITSYLLLIPALVLLLTHSVSSSCSNYEGRRRERGEDKSITRPAVKVEMILISIRFDCLLPFHSYTPLLSIGMTQQRRESPIEGYRNPTVLSGARASDWRTRSRQASGGLR